MVRDEAAKLIKAAIKRLYKIKTDPEVTYPEAKFGDLSTNIAFKLSKTLQRSPQKLATELTEALTQADISEAKAEAGFINLRMTGQFWLRQLEQVNLNYLRSNLGRGQKTQVEFISANPTGPLTIGNARGGFIGDVLANVLGISGFDVTKEYYFNDAGTQINELVKSVRAAAGEPVDGEVVYQGDYLGELAPLLEEADSPSAQKITTYIWEKYIDPTLKRMGIGFDARTNDKDLGPEYEAVKAELKDLIAEREKATWLLSTKLGDERDRVLEKASGDRTYLANDLAYHYQIFKTRGFERAIKIWGPDHAGQIPSLKLTIAKLFPNRQLDFLIHQWVRLMSGGREVKMSKRAGTFVTVDDLLEQIEPDVARWFFLMHAPSTHMDFDLDLAREQSQKNPFYYVMYAYVRARSILATASAKGLKPAPSLSAISDSETKIIRQLATLPDLIQELSLSYEVHQLTGYGQQLAKAFHDYYEEQRIIDLEPKLAAEKLALVAKIVAAMEAYWRLLGIKPREKM